MRRLRARRDGGGTIIVLWVLVLSNLIAPCFASAFSSLQPRASKNTTIPAPIIFTPNQDWEGIDGQWNSFSLLVGEPSQWVRVFISTASQQTWTIYQDADACASTTNKACFDSRGRAFQPNASSTWTQIGFYQLWLEQNLLNFTGNGLFGYDTVGIGIPGQEGPSLRNTTMGTIVSDDFWLGHFGVNAKPTNFTAFDEPSPSYMTYLYQQNLIPSLSFGYTAGAQYRLSTVLASLTLGGYDASRYIPNDLSFAFAPDNERDIVVGILDIRANGATDSNVDLIRGQDFDMYIDSTIAELWLPVAVCKAFEDTFGLQYDEETQLYLVNDTTHQELLARNASITFTLGQRVASNATVDITLPYSAFDKEARQPYRGLNHTTNFFPIRRGNDTTKQYVLGRTFLQEAYLIVDWERQNFSISQCSWVYGQETKIETIYGIGVEVNKPHKGPSTGAIIGIAVGCGFLFALLVCGIVGWFWRRRHKRKLAQMKAEMEESKANAAAAAKAVASASEPEETPISPVVDSEEGTNVFPKAELPADDVKIRGDSSLDEKDASSATAFELPSPAAEVDNTERQIFEMPGDVPVRQEADGRQLSEKESMMVRERIYNGIDPNEPQNVSPVTEHPRRPPPLLPSDVALVNRRLPVSPVTPLTPRTPRDGSHLEACDTFFQPPTRTPRDGRFLEAEDTLLSPISPMEGSGDSNRRRFSYEQ